ncbi:MAG TPA: response regulator [Steroidobacteraceae bacterium]|nr:response regulator [Steroidobacteraceae bacterium]
MNIRTVIADDEELARRGLRALSQRYDDVELVCECRNGREAVAAIHRHRPDLVFLDVQMPGKTGFDVISAIADIQRPHIVFVTAYDTFALRAFEVHALDYLLKPVNEERFDEALARVREAMSHATDNAIVQRIRQVAADMQVATSPSKVSAVDRLPIKVDGHIIVIRVAEIDWIEADRDYVSVHVGGKTWLMRETIAAVELRLALSGFVRIHRSALVNAERVKELRPQDKGEYTVVLNDGTKLKLTRHYRASVERLVGANI